MVLYKMCEVLKDDEKIGEVMKLENLKFPYLVLLQARFGASPIQYDKGYVMCNVLMWWSGVCGIQNI